MTGVGLSQEGIDDEWRVYLAGTFAIAIGGLALIARPPETVTVASAFLLFGAGAGFGAVLAALFLGSRPTGFEEGSA